MNLQSIIRRFALGTASLALAFALGGCSAAPVAPAAPDASVEEAQEAPAVAMADTPQALTPQQYQEQFAEAGAPYQLIDVRTPEEFATGYIAGAINIPLQELSTRLDEVSTEQPVVLYCRSGNRSGQAAQLLDAEGYAGIYNLGGITQWAAEGYPVETE